MQKDISVNEAKNAVHEIAEMFRKSAPKNEGYVKVVVNSEISVFNKQ